MSNIFRGLILSFLGVALFVILSCSSRVVTNQNTEPPVAIIPRSLPPIQSPSPEIPDLQAEIIDNRDKTTNSPIGSFDFKNHSYELPRGWENADRSEIKLVNGRVAPISTDVTDNMSTEEKAGLKAQRRIGLSFVTIKYLDVTGDGEDEAVLVLKIETGGAAIPQVVYIFTWKDEKPELIWQFRTGDRADGGLKDIRLDAGEMLIEIYGQDRFILGQTETGKITGDEEQLCCPTFYTRTLYKWNGKNFLLQGKRLTFSLSEPNAAPVENFGDKVNAPAKSKK